jgi:hypothetical protein
MDSVPLTPANTAATAPGRIEPLWLTRQQARHVMLAAALGVALTIRLAGLQASGFSDDEVAKIEAIDAYRHGNFSANAEHPMLMKMAMWASLDGARWWNATVPSSMAVGEETALRLPNAVAGVGTVAVMYALGDVLFGPSVALAAAAIVALDPNVTAINRIGKEDTLLMFFFLLGVCLYERAKVIGVTRFQSSQRWYQSSAVAFGLMLASKYMANLWGAYIVFNQYVHRDPNPRNRPIKIPYYSTVLAAFLVANWAALLPSTWQYCVAYVLGHDVQHHGFSYAQRIWTNGAIVAPGGVPWTYYLRLIATKVPLPVLLGAIAGLVPLVRYRRERGYAWLATMLVFTLVPYSLVATKFERYALPMLLLIDMLSAVGICAAIAWLWRRSLRPVVRIGLCTLAYAAVVGLLAAADSTAAPFYSLNQNAIGARLSSPASTFPEEAYDYGVREAVRVIGMTARPDATIVSDVPRVVRHYLEGAARRDLRVRTLSREGIGTAGEQWVIVQPEHVYFENASLIDSLRAEVRPWGELEMRGTIVLQVFRLER